MMAVMKTFFISIILSMSLFAIPYEKKIFDLFIGAQESFMVKQFLNGFLPQDIEAFLKNNILHLEKNERICFFFYPKGSGFDQLALDGSHFLEVGQVQAMAHSLGYKVITLESKRHMAYFENAESLDLFLKNNFLTSLDTKKIETITFLKDEKNKFIFPTKVYIVELEKL